MPVRVLMLATLKEDNPTTVRMSLCYGASVQFSFRDSTESSHPEAVPSPAPDAPLPRWSAQLVAYDAHANTLSLSGIRPELTPTPSTGASAAVAATKDDTPAAVQPDGCFVTKVQAGSLKFLEFEWSKQVNRKTDNVCHRAWFPRWQSPVAPVGAFKTKMITSADNSSSTPVPQTSAVVALPPPAMLALTPAASELQFVLRWPPKAAPQGQQLAAIKTGKSSASFDGSGWLRGAAGSSSVGTSHPPTSLRILRHASTSANSITSSPRSKNGTDVPPQWNHLASQDPMPSPPEAGLELRRNSTTELGGPSFPTIEGDEPASTTTTSGLPLQPSLYAMNPTSSGSKTSVNEDELTRRRRSSVSFNTSQLDLDAVAQSADPNNMMMNKSTMLFRWPSAVPLCAYWAISILPEYHHLLQRLTTDFLKGRPLTDAVYCNSRQGNATVVDYCFDTTSRRQSGGGAGGGVTERYLQESRWESMDHGFHHRHDDDRRREMRVQVSDGSHPHPTTGTPVRGAVGAPMYDLKQEYHCTLKFGYVSHKASTIIPSPLIGLTPSSASPTKAGTNISSSSPANTGASGGSPNQQPDAFYQWFPLGRLVTLRLAFLAYCPRRQVVAASCHICDLSMAAVCDNDFPHITLATGPQGKAKDSNSMLGDVIGYGGGAAGGGRGRGGGAQALHATQAKNSGVFVKECFAQVVGLVVPMM